jgi:ABC-type transport system involved in cytochrome c biogenesis permease subunit
VGVVLGGWWAADNLGRFWGWDPKEIGGLSVGCGKNPWLAGPQSALEQRL